MPHAPTHSLRLFRTQFHPCGYWPDRYARDVLLDPQDARTGAYYPQALAQGFRRSGEIVYRPDCVACQACVAARIPVAAFTPDRSQRRCLKRNADVSVRMVPAQRTDEHYALYRRYLQARHAGGGMDTHTQADFDAYLIERWSHGRFLEMRLKTGPDAGRLLGVAVTDVLPDALSAVYTFFAPEETRRSLGTFGVLSQIEWARREGRAYLYLGYWIVGHPKMDYKRRFQPLELFDGAQWQPAAPSLASTPATAGR